MLLANTFSIPFVPVRKSGKLPAETISEEYELEYGTAKLEIHTDAIKKGWNVVIHDDLLATGGTAVASSKLVERLGGNILSFLFVVELSFLNGKSSLLDHSKSIKSLIKYLVWILDIMKSEKLISEMISSFSRKLSLTLSIG